MASGDLWLKSGLKIVTSFATDPLCFANRICSNSFPVMFGVVQNRSPPPEPPDPPDLAPPHKPPSLAPPPQPISSPPPHHPSFVCKRFEYVITTEVKPNINPQHSTSSLLAVVLNLAGPLSGNLAGPSNSFSLVRRQMNLVSFPSLGLMGLGYENYVEVGLMGLGFEEYAEGLAYSSSLVNCEPNIGLWLMVFTELRNLVVGNECKAKIFDLLVTRYEAKAAFSYEVEECKRIFSVKSESLPLDQAIKLGLIVVSKLINHESIHFRFIFCFFSSLAKALYAVVMEPNV
ncbi:hypothetical protein AALP_AA7G085400 [Arabis alpina]|uniref:Uncharacterized protein n=1 Tax=Arabis alpina TaxID=50452 RepID=A0A087GGS3_ARAAL|nr:hypothetical protein AALP_AA7G085400 [Arabis alpina]